MGIPSDPVVSDICTEGLKKGGRVNPTAGDISDAQNIHFQEVKADIYLKAPRHFSLESVMCIGIITNVSRYNWPTNCEAIESIQLVDAPTTGSYQDTAQAGGANSITLASGYVDTSQTIALGRTIFIIGGTGNGQFAQITAYNDSTKVATIESNWTTLNSTWVTPDNTSIYLLENIRYKLWPIDKSTEWDTNLNPAQQMTPTRATLMDRQIWLDCAPNRRYAMPVTFWYALDQLDETSALFTGHLRKFRSLWVQGVASKVAQRFDDQRQAQITQMYNYMLDMYGASASTVGQVVFQDF